MVETANFEQSFWALIDFVHWQHPDMALPEKFTMAQALAEGLIPKGILQCVVIKYIEVKPNRLEVQGTTSVTREILTAALSNPHFWGQECSGILVGIEHDGPTLVALEPTEAGEKLLDEIFASSDSNDEQFKKQRCGDGA